MAEKLPDFRCFACGHDHFETGEIVAPLTILPDGTVPVRGDTNPELQVRCLHCGLMLHFDAHLIGLRS